jgi:hypothetical protein
VFAAGESRLEPIPQYNHARATREGVGRWVELGRLIERHTPPGASLIRPAIGAVGYHSGRTMLDPHGLVDRQVARAPAEEVPSHAAHIGGHDRYADLAFFEPRQPDYGYVELVQRETVAVEDPRLVQRIFRTERDQAFRTVYRPVLVPVPEVGGGEWHLLFAERIRAGESAVDRWSGPLHVPDNVRAEHRPERR